MFSLTFFQKQTVIMKLIFSITLILQLIKKGIQNDESQCPDRTYKQTLSEWGTSFIKRQAADSTDLCPKFEMKKGFEKDRLDCISKLNIYLKKGFEARSTVTKVKTRDLFVYN